MATATINIGYNQSAVTAGVAQTQQAMQQVSRSVQRANQQMAQSSGGMRNLGGVSMQLSDVAVQLQGGAQAATVLAQQGSQIASYFGPTGMIVGGVVAIGAGLYLMGQKGKEAFLAMVAETDSLHKSLAKISAAGTLPDLEEWTTKSRAGLTNLTAELDSLSNLWGGFKAVLGGDNPMERMAAIRKARSTAGSDIVAANQEAMAKSANELALAKSRAKGRMEETIILEGQLDLAKKIASIEASSFYANTKKQLIEDAKAASQANTQAKLKALQPDNSKEIEATKKRASEMQKAINSTKLESLVDADKIPALNAKLSGIFDEAKAKGGSFFESSIAGLEQWAQKAKEAGQATAQIEALTLLQEALATRKEIESTQARIVQKQREEAGEADSALSAMRKRRQEIREREEKKTTFRADVSSNLAILQAEADGNTRVAEALRRQQDIRERSLQIQQQLGVSAQTALGIAQQEDALKNRANSKVEQQKDGRIKGFSRERGDAIHKMAGIDGEKFEGLEKYKRLQAGGQRERKFAAFDDGLPLDVLTSPKRLAMAKAREKAGAGKGMAGVDGATMKEMLKYLEQIATSVAPLGGLE